MSASTARRGVYLEVFPDFKDLLGWVAFHPGRVSCFVERETVYPQPGGFSAAG